ncbi:MAG: Crp/Fnr family transcriptional regulator [Daejeonella sp.]
MDTSLLFQALARYCSPSIEEKDLLCSSLAEEEYPAGKLLQRQGHPCNRMWFISKGFIIGNYKENDQLRTSLFCPAGEFAASVPAFFQQRTSAENLIVREDCRLLSLSYENLRDLQHITSLFSACKGIMIRHHQESLQRIRSLLYDSPAIRLQKLLDRYPGVLEFAHPDEISSYLGISRRTLYRMLA